MQYMCNHYCEINLGKVLQLEEIVFLPCILRGTFLGMAAEGKISDQWLEKVERSAFIFTLYPEDIST